MEVSIPPLAAVIFKPRGRWRRASIPRLRVGLCRTYAPTNPTRQLGMEGAGHRTCRSLTRRVSCCIYSLSAIELEVSGVSCLVTESQIMSRSLLVLLAFAHLAPVALGRSRERGSPSAQVSFRPVRGGEANGARSCRRLLIAARTPLLRANNGKRSEP